MDALIDLLGKMQDTRKIFVKLSKAGIFGKMKCSKENSSGT
jgi:hypothetical protein